MSANQQPWPGAVETTLASASRRGLMARWAAQSATVASFAFLGTGEQRRIYVPLATTALAGAMSAADKAKSDAQAIITSVGVPLSLVAGVLGIADADATHRGTVSAAEWAKLTNAAAITSVAAPLTLAAGVLDIQAASASLEGSMDATSYKRANDPPAFRARHNANQSIATGTGGGGIGTALSFNTEDYDTHNGFATNFYTIPTGWGGVWAWGSSVVWDANVTGRRMLLLVLNGALYDYDERPAIATAGIGTPLRPAGEYTLAAGDTLQVNALQTSGVGLNVLTAGVYSPAVWGKWLRP